MPRSLLDRVFLILMGAGVGALIGAGVLFALWTVGPLGDRAPLYSDAGTVTGFGSVLVTPQVATPTAPPTALEPAPSEAPVERLLIPKIEVDAPVVVLSMDGNNVMQAPSRPFEVAWYDFSARPGFGSNAVFSGHVDFRDVGPAVFWELRSLTAGDLVQVRLADGTTYSYRVTALNSFPAHGVPVAEIVGASPMEVVTLITCSGTFDHQTRQYSHRVVVRAERIQGLEAEG